MAQQQRAPRATAPTETPTEPVAPPVAPEVTHAAPEAAPVRVLPGFLHNAETGQQWCGQCAVRPLDPTATSWTCEHGSWQAEPATA